MPDLQERAQPDGLWQVKFVLKRSAMAVMIPDGVEHFGTVWERQFYGFLKTAAKPDSKYLAWYLPDINGPKI